MRRLRGPFGGGGGAGPLSPATTAMAGLTVLGLLTAGCSSGGTGVRDEGAAVPSPVERRSPVPTGTAPPSDLTVDPVLLLRRDPGVGGRVKARLEPCAGGAYPVDTTYGDLTGSGVPDVVVNVMTCGGAVGLGTYVYRERDEKYEDVFAIEESAVHATIDRGELVVTEQVYAKGEEPMSYPSGENVVTYGWTDGRFAVRYRVRTMYSTAVGGSGTAVLEPPVPSES